MRIAIILSVYAGFLQAQTLQRNEITFSGGEAIQLGTSFERETAVGLGATYGYRILRYMQVETGVFGVLSPAPQSCDKFGCVTPNDHFIWIPFGARFIAPLKWDRVEVSLGGGGLYEYYSNPNPYPGGVGFSRTGWGGYLTAGSQIALDHGKHFWIGFTPRWFLANPPFARDRWMLAAGSVSYRF
jgi:hypothetical protein